MSLTTFSGEDLSVLKVACREGGEATTSLVATICAADCSPIKQRQVVQDSLLNVSDGAASFACTLAKGMRRLRILEGKENASDHRISRNRVLRRCCVSVSRIIDTDVDEDAATDIHRGLRQPALLLALTEVVRDNDTGADAQRAAASALLTFCEKRPSLWKELAKEIRGNSTLLKSFLAQAASLQSVTDHRTQELAFETVFRMWKVWKKQSGGPPALPPSTRSEVTEAIASMSIKDFDAKVRTMLRAINNRRREEAEEWDGAPLSSFALQAVSQVTDWAGLGCERAIGEVEWLDVGSDSVTLKVYQKGTGNGGKGYETATGAVFLSIPAEVVAASSRELVSTRSLRIEVPFTECPALSRVAEMPPSETTGGERCILVIRLGGVARDFIHLRKALSYLRSTVARERHHKVSKTSMAKSARDVRASPGLSGGRCIPRGNSAATSTAPRKQERDGGTVRKIDSKTTRKALSSCHTHKQQNILAAVPPESPQRRKSSSRKKRNATTTGTAPTVFAATVQATNPEAGDGDSARKAVNSTRRIAEGRTSDDGRDRSHLAANDEQGWVEGRWEEVGDSWIEPPRQLDLLPTYGRTTRSTPKPEKDMSLSTPSTRSRSDSTTTGATSATTAPQEKSTSRSTSSSGESFANRPQSSPQKESANRSRGKGCNSSAKSSEPLVPATPTPPPAQRRPRRQVGAEGFKALSRGSCSDGTGESSQDTDRISYASPEGRGTSSAQEEEEQHDGEGECSTFCVGVEGKKDQEYAPLARRRSSRRPRASTSAVAANGSPATGWRNIKGRRRRDCDNEGLEGLTVEETCPAWDQHHLCDALGTTMTMNNNNISVGGNVNSDDNGNGGNSNDEIDSNDRVETKDTVGGGAAAAAARGGSCSSGELLGEVDVEGEQEGGGSDEDNKEEGTGDDSIEEEADDAAERGGNDLEEEDSAILTQLFNQFVATAQARDQRTKKRKTDAVVEETKMECREYLERLTKVLTDHWRRQTDELLEQARQADEGVVAARASVEELIFQHESQWQASRDRMKKHHSALKRLDAQLSPGTGSGSVGSSKLDREWEADKENLRLRLQKHREEAVSRFTAHLSGPDKKRRKHGAGGGGGGSRGAGFAGGEVQGGGGATALFPGNASDISCLLNQLTMRTK